MVYSIYRIKCLNNNIEYIGRSQEVEKRWRAHKNMLRKSIHSNFNLQQDWNKYGESNFEFTIMYETNSLEESIKLEQQEIDNSNLKYNISDAKSGGDTFTNNPRKDEISKLKSKAVSGENNPMYGIPKSEKMINRTKEVNSKKVNIDGVVFNSLTDASKHLGIGVTTISYRLNSRGFKDWKYV